MKTMKRAAMILLALVLLAALAVPALAVDPPTTGSITIQRSFVPVGSYGIPSVYDYKYTLYRLFDATIAFDAEGNAGGIVYTCTDAQKAVEGFDTYFSVGTGNQVTVKDAAVAADSTLSQAAVEWIKANIEDLGTEVTVYTQWQYNQDKTRAWYENTTKTVGEEQVSFYTVHNLPFGYYYVDSVEGSVVMIDSTQPDATIVDKNSPPSFKKEITKLTNADGVEHNGDIQVGEDYPIDNHVATAQMGDTVQFTLTINAQKGAQAYILQDWQSIGLTLDEESVVIKAGGAVLDESNYALYTAANPDKLWIKANQNQETGIYTYDLYKGQNMSSATLVQEAVYTSANSTYYYGDNIFILFKQTYLDTITESTEITVTYDCVVNKDAAAPINRMNNTQSNPNNAVLRYGHQMSLYDNTVVYSAEIEVYKYEGDGDSSVSSVPLGGVKFVLKNADGRYLHQDGTTRAITWVEALADATEFTTESADTETLTGQTMSLGPFEPGTRDAYLTEDGIYYYTTQYAPFVACYLPGSDGVYDTADDVLQIAEMQYQNGFLVRVVSSYQSGPDGDWGTEDEVVTVYSGENAGYIRIQGLTNGTYTLVETYALPGYNKAPDLEITIDNKTVSSDLPELNSYYRLHAHADVANKTGSLLPHTGGMGVTIFYVVGAVLILGAGALLLRKRRTGDK